MGPQHDDQKGADSDRDRKRIYQIKMPAKGGPLLDKIRRNRAHLQSEKVLDLRRENDERYTACEPDDDGIWNEFDCGAKSGETHNHEDDAGHDCGDDQSVHPIGLNNAIDNNNEGAGWAAYLHFAPSQCGHNEAGNNGSEEPFLRRNTGSDCERNPKRQGDDADDQPCREISDKLFPGVVLECCKEFRFQHEYEFKVWKYKKIVSLFKQHRAIW